MQWVAERKVGLCSFLKIILLPPPPCIFFFFKVSSCHPLRVAQKVGGKVVFDELGPRNTPQRPQMVLTSELLIRLGSWDICGGIPSCFVSAETLKMCKMLGNRATNRISRSAYRSDV